MTEPNEHKKRPVTNAELEERLEKIPTRWEVRALILGAVVVSNVVPPIEMARAWAVGLFS